MPFLRSATVRTSTAHTSTLHVGRVRTVTLAVTCATVLFAVAPSPAQAEVAQAEVAPTPQIVDDALPARALPPAFAPDAATFCPRPTGRWWEDVSALSCVELLAGRDHTTPMTERELAWLNFGGLPAYATVDVGAIDAAIAAFTQRLAEEAAAAEAAARAAAEEARRAAERSRSRSIGSRRAPRDEVWVDLEMWDDSSNAWDAEDDRQSRVNAADTACRSSIDRPSDDLMPTAPEWDAWFAAIATCVDGQVPGHLNEWTQAQAEWDAQLEEGRRRQDAEWARFQERLARAQAEADATCPNGGGVSYFGFMVSSYDEVDVRIQCFGEGG